MGEWLDVKADDPMTVSTNVSDVPNGVIRIVTAQLSTYVRVEVRYPMANATPSNGNNMGTTLVLGPVAALTSPIFRGKK